MIRRIVGEMSQAVGRRGIGTVVDVLACPEFLFLIIIIDAAGDHESVTAPGQLDIQAGRKCAGEMFQSAIVEIRRTVEYIFEQLRRTVGIQNLEQLPGHLLMLGIKRAGNIGRRFLMMDILSSGKSAEAYFFITKIYLMPGIQIRLTAISVTIAVIVCIAVGQKVGAERRGG